MKTKFKVLYNAWEELARLLWNWKSAQRRSSSCWSVVRMKNTEEKLEALDHGEVIRRCRRPFRSSQARCRNTGKHQFRISRVVLVVAPFSKNEIGRQGKTRVSQIAYTFDGRGAEYNPIDGGWFYLESCISFDLEHEERLEDKKWVSQIAYTFDGAEWNLIVDWFYINWDVVSNSELLELEKLLNEEDRSLA